MHSGSPLCPLHHHRQRFSRDEPLTFHSCHRPKCIMKTRAPPTPSPRAFLTLTPSQSSVPELFSSRPGAANELSSKQTWGPLSPWPGFVPRGCLVRPLLGLGCVALGPSPLFRALEKQERWISGNTTWRVELGTKAPGG